MADDALTRKDAEMGRLTREDYKSMWELSERRLATSEELRTGLALSLESVREEADDRIRIAELNALAARSAALEEAAKVCDAYKEELLQQARAAPEGFALVGYRQLTAEYCAAAIRALAQHAPARVAEASTVFIPGECSPEYTNAVALSRALLSGPDFNIEANLHADTVAERHDTAAPESPAKEQPGEQRISSRTLAEWAVKAAKEPGTWEQKARDFLRSQQPPPPERP